MIDTRGAIELLRAAAAREHLRLPGFLKKKFRNDTSRLVAGGAEHGAEAFDAFVQGRMRRQ